MGQHDYTREQQLAAATAFATRLARKHAGEIDQMFPVVALAPSQNPATASHVAEITAILWATYLGHLAGHLTSLVGREAAASIIKQVVSVQSGADRAH